MYQTIVEFAAKSPVPSIATLRPVTGLTSYIPLYQAGSRAMTSLT